MPNGPACLVGSTNSQPVTTRVYAHRMTFAEVSLGLERRLHAALLRRSHAHSPLPAHLLTGERGEDAAYFHLRSLGYTIVARRWRSEKLPGDLDLAAWDGDTFVVFEIKTRTRRDLAPAETQVDPHKQRILRRMASAYLRQFPTRHRASVPVRFDVLAVYLLPHATEFEHFRNAFAFYAARPI
jgi:putative endonuclease